MMWPVNLQPPTGFSNLIEIVWKSLVYLLGDGRFVDADSIRYWLFFRDVVMETNIWLQECSTITVTSPNLVLSVVKRLLWYLHCIWSSFSETFSEFMTGKFGGTYVAPQCPVRY